MVSNSINVGILCPYSTVYPDMAQNIMHGILAGLPGSMVNNVTFVPEYINQGEPEMIATAIQKLLGFHQVDILTGLVSYKTLTSYTGIIKKSGKPALFIDLGEYIPDTHTVTDSVFFNSFFYWQAEYALGVWAQKTFGDKGTLVMPLYESGYHMHSSFRQGAVATGNEVLDYIVLPYDPEKKQGMASHFDELTGYFEKNGFPSYLHLLFSGDEAVNCCIELARQPWSKQIPVVVSPHMGSPEICDLLPPLTLELYTASLWRNDSDTRLNKEFITKYGLLSGKQANTIALLGFEVGMVLGNLHDVLLNKDYAKAKQLMREERIKTPRGERSFYMDSDHALPVIDIEKLSPGSPMRRLTIDQGRAMPYNHDIYMEIHNESISGWKNPYLCV